MAGPDLYNRTRSPTKAVDDRMTGPTRLILAVAALLIIYIDPAEPDRYVSITYGALISYVLYSAAILVLISTNNPLARSIKLWAYWGDVCWYTVLIALSSGTNSVFFIFYFFPILVASFRMGFASGLRVAIISSALFIVVGSIAAPPEPQWELSWFLLRPILLLVLGYMIAFWGESEVTLKRRLALLREVTMLSNPRFGVDHTIGSIMERLRFYHDADTCLFVTADAEAPSTYLLHRADRHHPEGAVSSEHLSQVIPRNFFALLGEYAIVYSKRHRHWRSSLYAYDLAREERSRVSGETGEGLANLLDTNSFVSVPMRWRNETVGRLFLTSRQHRFAASSIDFIRQVIEQTMPVIENIRLLDRLASEAAEQERQKISRDIYDSVIQPYIGLKLGLDALRQKVKTDNPLASEVDDLIRMANAEIGELRRYIGELRSEGSVERGDVMLSSVRRQAAKFGELYDIKVEVEAHTRIVISDRLAAEAFQIVREGLSNIKRHTTARHVKIYLACDNDLFTLRIENDQGGSSSTPLFVPRSITERATALGGEARVARHDQEHTLVEVAIPL